MPQKQVCQDLQESNSISDWGLAQACQVSAIFSGLQLVNVDCWTAMSDTSICFYNLFASLEAENSVRDLVINRFARIDISWISLDSKYF